MNISDVKQIPATVEETEFMIASLLVCLSKEVDDETGAYIHHSLSNN